MCNTIEHDQWMEDHRLKTRIIIWNPSADVDEITRTCLNDLSNSSNEQEQIIEQDEIDKWGKKH